MRGTRAVETMLRYTINRVLLMIPTLIGVAVLVFFMLRVVPGDVVEIKLRGDGGTVSQETIEMERKRLGLDKPLVTQFGDWMVGHGEARFRQVDVDRAAGDRGDRAPARIVAAGRDHGDAHRGADRDAAGHAGGAVPRHLDRLSGPHPHHRRAVDPVVLVRHADHAEPARRSSTGCRRSRSRRSMSIRSPTSRS